VTDKKTGWRARKIKNRPVWQEGENAVLWQVERTDRAV
jgi:hypothetical protein